MMSESRGHIFYLGARAKLRQLVHTRESLYTGELALVLQSLLFRLVGTDSLLHLCTR